MASPWTVQTSLRSVYAGRYAASSPISPKAAMTQRLARQRLLATSAAKPMRSAASDGMTCPSKGDGGLLACSNANR